MQIHTAPYGRKYHTIQKTSQPHKSEPLETNLRAADVLSMSVEWLIGCVLKDGLLSKQLIKVNQLYRRLRMTST